MSMPAPRVVAVAASGGRDSMALLHCTARAAAACGVEVVALHVHHGLMAEADEWAAFVESACRRWARRWPLRFALRRLQGAPPRGASVEAWARAGRYAALAQMAHEGGASLVLLAHHREDQAETFLLQALRGAGPAGLAAMPAAFEREGLAWARPWLAQPRAAIDAYVRRHRIAHVDDASNADPRFARSRLRQVVMPALVAAFADAPIALAAAAQRAAQARALIDEVARADLELLRDDDGALCLAPWQALTTARRREALRAWLSCRGERGAAESLIERLMNELTASAKPAQWPCGSGLALRRWRGRLIAEPTVAAARARLHVRPVRSGGIPLALLAGARWQARRGAEQFQRAPGTPPRSLKKQFQAAAVPAWARDAPLLVAADGTLIFVPGLGCDARARAAPGAPRVSLAWQTHR